MTVYTKSMMEALAEVRGLQEDNMDLMRKAAGGAAQKIKFKDKKSTVDSFTASAIMGVYDKVNPSNKKKMETIINSGNLAQFMKLQSMAMKAIKSEYGEETELDEKLISARGKDVAKKMMKSKTMKPFAKEVAKMQTVTPDKLERMLPDYVAGKDIQSMFEEVDLDEAKLKIHWQAQTKDGKGMFQIVDRDTKGMAGKQDKFKMQIVDKRGKVIKDLGSHVSVDSARKFAWNKKIVDPKNLGQMSKGHPQSSLYTDDVELEEGRLEVVFKDKQTAERAYNYINNEIWASGNPPYDDISQEGNEIHIEMDDNLNRRNQMLKDLKALQRNMKFKVGRWWGEDVDLDEGTWKMPKSKKQIAPLLKLMRKPVKLGKDGDDAAKVVAPYIGDDELEDDLYAAGKKNPNGDARPAIRDALQRFGLPWEEEVELDEGKEKAGRQLVNPNKEVMIVKKSKVIVIDKKDQDKYLKQGWTLAEEDESEKKYKVTNDKLGVWTGSARSEEDAKEQALSGWGVVGNVEYARNTTVELIEEVELDEGRMKELHGYIAQGMSAKEIAKKMKLDVKTIEALMAGYGEAYELGTDEYREYLEKLTPGEKREVEEASARADAMRAMRRSKKVDPADVDTSASDDDVKAASKHIIMQMRKVISLKGDFKVEFGDKKKVKIPVKIAQTVIQKYNKLKKPADKEKFQNQVAKSHRDMLTVLKAGYMAAAYESTDTILERIDKKIKEIREGTKNG